MTNYAVIGDGAVGTTAAFYIRRHDPDGRITIYSDEPTPAYYRAALTNYLMGELTAQQLFAVPPTSINSSASSESTRGSPAWRPSASA